MKRKLYENLLEWKNQNDAKPLMVLGVRQCGKTYLVEQFCKNEFENYKCINLFRDKNIVELYSSSLNSFEKFARLKVLLDFDLEKPNSILFIDEIQESEELIAELKYFCEEHKNIKIICAGSLLRVKVKRSKVSFPVGKVKLLNMYPMDFEEFLIAMGEENLLEFIKSCYAKNKQLGAPLHDKALNLYRMYLVSGGMPENVLNLRSVEGDYIKYDDTILKDIITSYFNDMAKYVTSESEALKIKRIYQSLPTQLANKSHKFQFSKIDEDARSRNFETAIDWLYASNMIIGSSCVKLPEIPLAGFKNDDIYKLYLSDVGILVNLLGIKIKDVLQDNISLYKGIIAENYVANQLVANGHDLYYWMNDNQSEIDFLLYNDDGIIPIEVKAANNTQAKSLKSYIKNYNPKYSIRIGSKDFGYDPKTKIKSIPLYAAFLIK